ncbi:MAG TPA: ABC transporter permease [Candidatus Limnocylindrales bacterium]|nr:ABC transporter permease [Candidatus Limnocylindrales bacterium]
MTGSDAAALRGDATTRGRKRKKLRNQPGTPAPVEQPVAAAEEERSLRAGWRVIAAKEFSDHILSVRFLVLTVILGLAAAAAVYATAGAIRDIATDASGAPSLFLKLFTVSRGDIPSFTTFIAFLGPLLGIAFGFDAINGERSEGTLPRLLSQPIHRDDVINGKFVAGLSAITVIFVAVTLVVTAVGIFQLGILPDPEEIARLIIWVGLAVAYVGLWLAIALLCSVLLRRAATSALVAIAVWLLVTLFATLVVGLIAGFIAPIPADAAQGSAAALRNTAVQQELARLSPSQLFEEATAAVLDPSIRTLSPGLVTAAQADRAIPSILSLPQSLLVIWPQFVALVAATAVMFALAYVSFMRQEVRA